MYFLNVAQNLMFYFSLHVTAVCLQHVFHCGIFARNRFPSVAKILPDAKGNISKTSGETISNTDPGRQSLFA